MPIINLFSKRQKQLRGEIPDVYEYEYIPTGLRIQIVHIWRDVLPARLEIYQQIESALCRELGIFELPSGDSRGARYPDGSHPTGDLADYFIQVKNYENALDVIEFVFGYIQYWNEKNYTQEVGIAAISELNARFQEHAIGYQYANGEIIRIDSQLIHAEVVKPALALLQGKGYEGAQQEFLKSHEHYRHGNTKEALVDALKAFESTMKVICKKRGWSHAPNAACKDLIKVCFDKGLIPAAMDSHYSGLRSVLESGVPTLRNKNGGHGQGAQVVAVPQHMVAYALHMTASTIVFLVESEQTMK